MAIAIPRLPDLGSAHEVQAFWGDNQGLMHGIIISTSVGFLFLLAFLGVLIEPRLPHRPGRRRDHRGSFSASAADVHDRP